jgi:hypothetical protein
LHVERICGPCKYVLASDWMVGVVCVLEATQEVLLVGCGGLDPTGRVELLRGPCQQVEQFQHFGALAAGVVARHFINWRDSAWCCAV